MLIAFLINLPHLIWLIRNDFFSWGYFVTQGKPTFLSKLFSLVSFYSEQFSAIAGTLVIFLVLYFVYKNNREEKVINFEDAIFVAFLGFGPVIMQSLLSLFSSSRLIGAWGYPMLFMSGIALYYFFPIKVNEKYFSSFIKAVYCVMTILFLVFFILFSVEKNFRSSYPYEVISKDFEQVYKAETGKDLKYVTGYIEFALPITIYGESHPQIIFDTYSHKNIWIDENEVRKNGVLIVSRRNDMKYENLIPYDSEDKNSEYKVYKFTIQNKLKQKRDYDLYYKIIKPEN